LASGSVQKALSRGEFFTSAALKTHAFKIIGCGL
jgi:hypothetical protein